MLELWYNRRVFTREDTMTYNEKVQAFSDKWQKILNSNDKRRIFSKEFVDDCKELEFKMITDENELSNFIEMRTGAIGDLEVYKCQTEIKDVGTMLFSAWNQFNAVVGEEENFPVDYSAFLNALNYLKYLSSDSLEKVLESMRSVTINTFPHKKERGKNKYPQALTIDAEGSVSLNKNTKEDSKNLTASIDKEDAKKLINDLFIGFNGFKAVVNLKNIGGWTISFNDENKEYVKGKYGTYLVNGEDISDRIRKLLQLNDLVLFDNK